MKIKIREVISWMYYQMHVSALTITKITQNYYIISIIIYYKNV
jgi:hypothetical protein